MPDVKEDPRRKRGENFKMDVKELNRLSDEELELILSIEEDIIHHKETHRTERKKRKLEQIQYQIQNH